MKKIISIMLLIMLAPMIVLADSAGPKILGYDAVVINKDGAKCERYADEEEIIPYNTKIHVRDEYSGEAEACFLDDRDNCIRISLKDIAPLKEEILPKDLSNVDDHGSSLEKISEKLLILKESGIKLKKGPSTVFGEYDTVVPNKTVLVSSYGIDRGKGGVGWYYIDSNGYKGWIDAQEYYDNENADYVYIMLQDKAMFFVDTDFYSDRTFKTKVFTVPAFTVIDKIYSGRETFVEYNGKEGFSGEAWDNYSVESQKGYVLTLKKTELKKNGKVLATIPAGEKLKIKYGRDDLYGDYRYHDTAYSYCDKNNKCYYYVVYKNQEGLVDSKNVESLYYESKVIDKTFKYNLKIYDFSNNDRKDNETDEAFLKRHETGKVVPANTKVTSYNQDEDAERELVKYNDIIGWVVLDEVGRATEVPDDSITEPLVTENDENTEKENVIVPDDDKQEESETFVPEDNEERSSNSPVKKSSDTLMYALIGALLVCVTAVITAVIVNGKNKKAAVVEKKEEPKSEAQKNDTKEETVPEKKEKLDDINEKKE